MTDLLRRSIKKNQTEILQIFVNNEQDGGTFTCLASNPIGKSEKHFFVDIFLPPTFEYVSTNRHKIAINRTYTLPCLVKGIPRPIIRWFKDGKHISIDVNDLRCLSDPLDVSLRRRNASNYFVIISIWKFDMSTKMMRAFTRVQRRI